MVGGIAGGGEIGQDIAPLLAERGDGGQQALDEAAARRGLGAAAAFAPEHGGADRPFESSRE